jgi:electron transfer flavoprotein beta subunit
LRDAVAAGAARAVRIDGLGAPGAAPSDRVAAALAAVLSDARVVVCGDRSLDRGSGSVPAFLAARLGAAQALGATAVDRADGDALVVTRRLDGGRRERLRVPAGGPAVISVEGGAARLRRASLPGVVAARAVAVEVVAAAAARGTAVPPRTVRTAAHRPRPRRRPAPVGADPHARILTLTGAMVARTPPVLVHLEPMAAAARILDQLRQWGYVEPG